MACNLSSINLHKFCMPDGTYDFKSLYETSYMVTKLMDNLIDVMDFPDERFRTNVLKYRPIGVGLMGLSDVLYEMGLPYDSKEGQLLAGEIMKTITTACVECSADLAFEKEPFGDYSLVADDVYGVISSLITDVDVLKKVKKYGVRNCQHTTIAPTGSIALSCDCSYGMEPCFGLVFTKTLSESGDVYHLVNPIFKRKYENESWYASAIEKIVQNGGSLKGIRGVPKEVRDVFVVAHDIKPKDRIDMQSILQKYCSTGISSCVCPDTLIETSEGLFYIDELYDFNTIGEGEFKENFDSNKKVLDCMMEYSEISQFYNNGVAPVFKLTLKNGLEIKCTGNEKFILLDDVTDMERWSELSFLSEGDRIKIKHPLF